MDTAELNKLTKWAIEHRRYFHQYPELSGEEFETRKYIKQHLDKLNIEILNYEPPSIVGYLKGTEGSTTIALRADMDALPVEEEGEKSYISQKPGVSHVCGHDGHMAVLLAVAKWLSEHRREIKPNIVFIFQSSEEMSPSGAESLIRQGVLNEVDMIFGIHLWQPLQKGKIGIRSGAMMASVDDFRITIEGMGGHGASPHETVDSVYISSHIIGALQSIISRRIDPLNPAVISVGKMEAGTSYNIIPTKVSMYGAIRTLSNDTRHYICSEMKKVIEGICNSFGANGSLELFGGLSPVMNDKEMSHFVGKTVKTVFGTEVLVHVDPTMASEDFSCYLEKRKGAFIFVGTGGEKSAYPHHHPKFDIDEDVLETAINLFIGLVLNYEE
ncbi:M20 metallopeptidase family protein [Peribacillus frigoritolerans]|uniref:M20 metallopeptidase family protein n=1 Tax=Peribacillus frigoritolerans TaxID=450367 RepID=UPI0020792D35|nr:amidohydrolase [Peribacillus frigoritolerans]USK82537.1 amidohydrolase [Peribacillus frigoritolerans]